VDEQIVRSARVWSGSRSQKVTVEVADRTLHCKQDVDCGTMYPASNATLNATVSMREHCKGGSTVTPIG
jgi:hypothetical protein